MRHRLAHREPADPEVTHQLRLGGKLRAGLVLARFDLRFQRFRNLQPERLSGPALEGRYGAHLVRSSREGAAEEPLVTVRIVEGIGEPRVVDPVLSHGNKTIVPESFEGNVESGGGKSRSIVLGGVVLNGGVAVRRDERPPGRP